MNRSNSSSSLNSNRNRSSQRVAFIAPAAKQQWAPLPPGPQRQPRRICARPARSREDQGTDYCGLCLHVSVAITRSVIRRLFVCMFVCTTDGPHARTQARQRRRTPAHHCAVRRIVPQAALDALTAFSVIEADSHLSALVQRLDFNGFYVSYFASLPPKPAAGTAPTAPAGKR